MIIDNLTDHCFVLSAGVIIQPNASNVSVADALYAADSTLNSQLDALDAEDFISITGKPDDPFSPILQSQSPVTLQAHDAAETPLTVVGHSPQNVPVFLARTPGAGNAIVLQPLDGSWNRFTVDGHGDTYIYPDADAVALTLGAFTGQTANLLEAYDENGDIAFRIDATGYVETNASGLSINHLGGMDAGYATLQPNAADYLILEVALNNLQSARAVSIHKGGAVYLTVEADGSIRMPSLATSDPHVAGQLWNSAGTLKVSAGP